MLTVHQAADYLVAQAAEHGDRLDHVKLQRLCYFAQGFHLALWGQRLFGEQLRAWAYGPVTSELRDRFGDLRGPLPLPADRTHESLTTEQRSFLDIVLARFREYPGPELSRMTQHDAPWREAYANLKHGQGDAISDESLVDWFRPWLHELDTSEAPPPPTEERVRQARQRYEVAAAEAHATR